MKRFVALSVAGALAAGFALVAAPRAANAQVGLAIGFGAGEGYYHDDYYDGPGLFGIGGPVGFYGGYAPSYRSTTTYEIAAPVSYAEPVYRVVRRPARRVVVRYAPPAYDYAPRRVVRTRVVTRAPRYVTRVAPPDIRRTVVERRVYY